MSVPKNINGFTLIELMVVVSIIMTLAAIALPNFVRFRQKGYDSAAASDIKNAYTAAQAYFSDYTGANITLDKIKAKGYKQTEHISLTVLNDNVDTLKLQANHVSGYKTYSVDSSGRVTYDPPD